MKNKSRFWSLATIIFVIVGIFVSTNNVEGNIVNEGTYSCFKSVTAPALYHVASVSGSASGSSLARATMCVTKWSGGSSSKCVDIPRNSSASLSGGVGYEWGYINAIGTLGQPSPTCDISASIVSNTQQCPSGQTWNGFACVNIPATNVGGSCTSAPNSCGMTNTGTVQSNFTCSATSPSNSLCSSTPGGPSVSGGTGTTPFGPTNPDLKLQICSYGDSAPCKQGWQVPVNTPQRFSAWYSNNEGRSWRNVTESDGLWWRFGNEERNSNMPEYNYNNSCSAGYCLTYRGIRYSPVSSEYGPYDEGVFMGIVKNLADCKEDGHGCPAINANYSGTGAQIFMRIGDPVTPTCAAGANIGNACTSQPNSCGMINNGTIQCDGSCSAAKPADNQCKAISGKVFDDRDVDGVLDNNESGISGMSVSLRDRADTMDLQVSVTTNGSGNYSFSNISQSEYRIKWNVPSAWTSTNDNSRTINDAGASVWNFGATASNFNYSLSNSGTSNVTKSSGNAFTQNVITQTITSGSAQSISLSVSGVPSGVSYSVAPSSCLPNCVSVITFTVAPTAPVGTHSITVTGSPLSRTTSFNLVVAPGPGAGISSCTASPATGLLVGQNVTLSATVSGGNPPYTYAWSGTNMPSPAPSENPYTRTYNTVGQKTATLTVTDADGIVTSCASTPAVFQVNFNPSFEEF